MSTRRSWRSGIALGLLAVMLLPAGAGAADAPTATVHEPAEVKKRGRALVFTLTGIDAERCRRGSLNLRRKTMALETDAVVAAVEHGGELRTKLPRRWLPERRSKRTAREARLEIILDVNHPEAVDGGDKPPGATPSPPHEPPVPAPGPPLDEGLRVGLVANAQGYDPNSAGILDEAAQTGARWLREEFAWDVIEPRNDTWR
ncbi:MAG: hypothetical protein ACRDMA_17920, partial [Solirubrobacterales bacterium]